MAHSSELTPGVYFVWRTKRPYETQDCISPVFSFLDAKWSMQMCFSGTEIWVNLYKSTNWGNFQPFHVTTWIENDRNESNSIDCQRTEVKCDFNSIWEMTECNPLTGMPDFTDYFTFVCMFPAVSQSGQKIESKHQSIQVSLEYPPDIEGLSLDLGNLLEKSTMPDVQLKCGDDIVPAHRSVLIARSEVFEAMFRNDMAESRSGVVDMPGVDSEVLALLLKYVYTGKIPETSVDLMGRLYSASNKYAIHGLKKACSDCMRGDLNEENCLDYLVLADTHCDASLKDVALSFIVENQWVLLRSTAWFRFSKEQPILAVEVYHMCFEMSYWKGMIVCGVNI